MSKALDLIIERQRELGYPARLVEHHRVVAEVAGQIVDELDRMGASVAGEEVLVMAAIHDCGKSLVPYELSEAGQEHTTMGKVAALDLPAPLGLHKICESHHSADYASLSLEELVVCLGDKLWKGKRVVELELAVAQVVVDVAGGELWSVFERLDRFYEGIAQQSDIRLLG